MFRTAGSNRPVTPGTRPIPWHLRRPRRPRRRRRTRREAREASGCLGISVRRDL